MKRLVLVNLLLACATFSFTAQAADKKIERLYGSKCGSCHGKDGKAQTEKGKKMAMRDIASEEFQKISDADMTRSRRPRSRRSSSTWASSMSSSRPEPFTSHRHASAERGP